MKKQKWEVRNITQRIRAKIQYAQGKFSTHKRIK